MGLLWRQRAKVHCISGLVEMMPSNTAFESGRAMKRRAAQRERWAVNTKGGHEMKTAIAALLIAVSLSGCMSTPYQPSGLTGGFSVMQVREDVWRVRFGGNGYTTRETAQTYWLFRAADLALEKGYDGFELLSQIPLVRPKYPDNEYAYESFFVRTAAGPVYIPIYSGDQSNHPLIEGDIRLLKRPFEASPPKVFDAAALKTALDPYVNGKKCDLNSTSGNVCPHVHEYLFPKGKL